MEEKIEGLLLQSTPYLGKKKILKLFTPQLGMITLFTKGANLCCTTPYSIAEWVIKPTKSELFTLVDATLLDGLDELKKDYTTLSSAGQIVHALISSQMAAQRSVEAYQLTLAYLKKIAHFQDPDILTASYRLKLLKLEGLVLIETNCRECQKKASAIHEGEAFCQTHTPSTNSYRFSLDEWDTIYVLAHAKQFSALNTLLMPDNLKEKIDHLFKSHIAS